LFTSENSLHFTAENILVGEEAFEIKYNDGIQEWD